MANQDDPQPPEDDSPEQRAEADSPHPAPHPKAKEKEKPPEKKHHPDSPAPAKPPAKKKPPVAQHHTTNPQENGDVQKTAGNVGNAAVKQASFLAALAMAGANAFQKIIVYCLYAILLVAILAFVFLNDSTQKMEVGVAAMVCFFLALGFILWNYKLLSADPASGPVAPGPAPAPEPPPTVVLSPTTKEVIREALNGAREYAFQFLKKKIPELEDKKIRANIFLPEYQRVGNKNTCVLRIRPGLHFNMNHPAELGIEFQPGQGATGQVFSAKEARVAQRLSDHASPGDWEQVYKITEAQARQMHRDLKWVISMPLKWDSGECLGVLNIDGLVYEPDIDDLYELSGKLSQWILIIAGFLKE